MRVTLPSLFLLACVGCNNTSPLEAALPPLPPEGGAPLAAAGRLDATNFDTERVPGPASQGLVGDYFMRNDKVRIVVQAPGRAIGPCPFGGNVIDADRIVQPAGDQLGEVSAFLQLGRTFAFDRAVVVRDGSKGGPAVLRFYGHDAKNDFIDVVGLGGFALAVQDDYRADVDLSCKPPSPTSSCRARPSCASSTPCTTAAASTRTRRGARSPTPARRSRCSIPSAASARRRSAPSSPAASRRAITRRCWRAASPMAWCRRATRRQRFPSPASTSRSRASRTCRTRSARTASPSPSRRTARPRARSICSSPMTSPT